MGNYLCIFLILIFFILSTIFIKKYNNKIKKKNKSAMLRYNE